MSADMAQCMRAGGICGGEVRRSAARWEMTMVPAAMSPSRLARGCTIDAMMAGTPTSR
jgi:hypothetical protein